MNTYRFTITHESGAAVVHEADGGQESRFQTIADAKTAVNRASGKTDLDFDHDTEPEEWWSAEFDSDKSPAAVMALLNAEETPHHVFAVTEYLSEMTAPSILHARQCGEFTVMALEHSWRTSPYANITPPESTMLLDWRKLGRMARVSADDAHEGNTPMAGIAWQFLLDNPECFIGQAELDIVNGMTFVPVSGEPMTMADVEIGNVGWPEELIPDEIPAEFVAGYRETMEEESDLERARR